VPGVGSVTMVCSADVIFCAVLRMCALSMSIVRERAVELRGGCGTRSGSDHVGPHAVCKVLG
jgi:hypothetical protein